MPTPPRSRSRNSTTSGTTSTAGELSSTSTRMFPMTTRTVTRSDTRSARTPTLARRRRLTTTPVSASCWMTLPPVMSASSDSDRRPTPPRTRSVSSARLLRRRPRRMLRPLSSPRRRLARRLRLLPRLTVSPPRRQRRLPRTLSRRTSVSSRVPSRTPTTSLPASPRPLTSTPFSAMSRPSRPRLTPMRLLLLLASSTASRSLMRSRLSGLARPRDSSRLVSSRREMLRSWLKRCVRVTWLGKVHVELL